MSSLGLEGKEVENLFRRFDPDKSGFLDKQDWASRCFREYNLQKIYEYELMLWICWVYAVYGICNCHRSSSHTQQRELAMSVAQLVQFLRVCEPNPSMWQNHMASFFWLRPWTCKIQFWSTPLILNEEDFFSFRVGNFQLENLENEEIPHCTTMKQLFDKETAWRLGVFCFVMLNGLMGSLYGFARPTLSSMPCWSVVWPQRMSLKTPFWRPAQLGKCGDVTICYGHLQSISKFQIVEKHVKKSHTHTSDHR